MDVANFNGCLFVTQREPLFFPRIMPKAQCSGCTLIAVAVRIWSVELNAYINQS